MSHKMNEHEYKIAVRQGHEVALAVAIKRFRDEYGWTAEQVKAICSELLAKLDSRMAREIATIADDLTRMEGMARPKESMHCTIVASMALIGAQICEGFELSRRAGRN